MKVATILFALVAPVALTACSRAQLQHAFSSITVFYVDRKHAPAAKSDDVPTNIDLVTRRPNPDEAGPWPWGLERDRVEFAVQHLRRSGAFASVGYLDEDRSAIAIRFELLDQPRSPNADADREAWDGALFVLTLGLFPLLVERDLGVHFITEAGDRFSCDWPVTTFTGWILLPFRLIPGSTDWHPQAFDDHLRECANAWKPQAMRRPQANASSIIISDAEQRRWSRRHELA